MGTTPQPTPWSSFCPKIASLIGFWSGNLCLRRRFERLGLRMDLGKLLNRWIEVLAGVYVACRDAWGSRQAMLISSEGNRFVIRKMPTRRAAMRAGGHSALDGQSVDAGPVIAEIVPGKSISRRTRRLARDSLVVLKVPPAEVVVRRISVPAQAREFLSGIVRNQLDRLSPWQSDQAVYGFDASPSAEDPAALDVRVLIAGRADIDQLRERLAATGLVVDRVVAGPDQGVTLWSRLAALTGPELVQMHRGITASIAVAVFFFAAISVCELISAVSLRAQSEDAESTAKTLLHQVEGGRSAASLQPPERAWFEKETATTTTIALEAISRALPDAAYLTEMHIERSTLRMIGLAADPPSLIAPLEKSGHLAEVHFFAPTTRESDGGLYRFHIEAQIKPHATIAAEGS
jgi:general secretion pathway protein L